MFNSTLKDSDFVGFYKISKGKFTDIQTYIEKFEQNVLIELLGVELFNLYKADLDPNGFPQTQRFIDLYNELMFEHCSTNWHSHSTAKIYISKGIKPMLLGFIWYWFQRDAQNQNTTTGAVKNVNENSTQSGFMDYAIFDKYNISVGYYKAIQMYCMKNETLYPEFNGVDKLLIGGII